MYEALIRGAIGGLGKLRRRQRPHAPGNAPRVDGHPAGRGLHLRARTAAEAHAVGLKAGQLSRAAQRAVGQMAQLVRLQRLHKLGKARHRPRLHDQHGQAAAVLPQAVAGVDQGGEIRAEPVPFQSQLYVPAEADMPPAPEHAGQSHQPQRRHGQIASRPASAGGGAAPAHQRGNAHAGRSLQHAPGTQAAGEQRGGDHAGGSQPGPAAQPAESDSEKAGEDRIKAEREQRPQQLGQMQPSQRKLHRSKDAGVHQQINGEKGLNGHRRRTSLSMSYHMEKDPCFQEDIVVNFKIFTCDFRQSALFQKGERSASAGIHARSLDSPAPIRADSTRFDKFLPGSPEVGNN